MRMIHFGVSALGFFYGCILLLGGICRTTTFHWFYGFIISGVLLIANSIWSFSKINKQKNAT